MLKKIAARLKAMWLRIVAFVRGEWEMHLHVHIDAAALSHEIEQAVAAELKAADARSRAFIKREIAKALAELKKKRGR